MNPDHLRPTLQSEGTGALGIALEKSHDVQERVEACAEELGAANDSVKKHIDQGATTLSAADALQSGERVKAQVQDCADDMKEVTEHLAQGIEDLEQVEGALARSRADLADTEHALERARAEERQATLRATHDPATGLANRGLFDDRLAHGIPLADHNQWTLAVMFLDRDRFKRISDDHGHATGDRVLKEVARRLQQFAREGDTACRSGGDEFLLLLMNPKGRANVLRIAHALHQDITGPMAIGGVESVVGVSIGIALYPLDALTGHSLVERADSAMYRAKMAGGGCAMHGPGMPGPDG